MIDIQKIANTNHTVLITGRTGTGKSYLAKKIHDLSHRKDKKFISINLATLSENLIESELFGHEKGAFSGADLKRIGKLESGNGGTIFLDEIGELSPRLQTKLLEALNSQTISPVGSNREIQLDIRIITATNQDLLELIRKGQFREDLYFRINTFQINIPCLKETKEKISTLAMKFANESSRKQNKQFISFDPYFLDQLKKYPWPGNIRELKNAIDFSVAMSINGILTIDCLPPYVKSNTLHGAPIPRAHAFPVDYREAKSFFEKSYLNEILVRFGGKINLTARETGLSKVTLIEKIRRYEINIPKIKYEVYETTRGLK